MKKVILSAIAAVCFAGIVWSQDEKKDVPVVPATPVDPVQQEFNQLLNDWIQYNGWDKEAAYTVLDDIRQKLNTDFPLDPEVAKAVKDLQAQHEAALLAKAKEMGYDNVKAATASSDHEAAMALEMMMKDFWAEESALTTAYYAEFNHRYEMACIDAMKRLMENAETMK